MSATDLLIIDAAQFLTRRVHAACRREGEASDDEILDTFRQALMRITEEVGANDTVVVFDAEGPTWHQALWPTYSPKLTSMPEDLRALLPEMRRQAAEMELPVLAVPGYESDDVAAGLAAMMVRQGARVTVVSADPELCALLPLGVEIREPFGDIRRDSGWVRRRFAVTPEQVPDLYALAGRRGIPGLWGVGAAQASAWLSGGHTIESLLESARLNAGAKEAAMLLGHAFELMLFKVLFSPRTDLFATNTKLEEVYF